MKSAAFAMRAWYRSWPSSGAAGPGSRTETPTRCRPLWIPSFSSISRVNGSGVRRSAGSAVTWISGLTPISSSRRLACPSRTVMPSALVSAAATLRRASGVSSGPALMAKVQVGTSSSWATCSSRR